MKRSDLATHRVNMTMKTTRRIVVACAVLSSVGVSDLALAQFGALTPSEIEEAITLGIAEQPEPYIMRSAPPHERRSDRPPGGQGWGLVFTPLRVQFASRQAWTRTGHRLTPAEISPEILAPVIHVVPWLGWLNPPEMPCKAHPPRFAVYQEGFSPYLRDTVQGLIVNPHGIQPLWARRGFATLEAYGAASLFGQPDSQVGPTVWGGTPGFDDNWAVVGYPLEFFRSDLDFVVIFGDGKLPGTCLKRGVIPAAELATWR